MALEPKFGTRGKRSHLRKHPILKDLSMMLPSITDRYTTFRASSSSRTRRARWDKMKKQQQLKQLEMAMRSGIIKVAEVAAGPSPRYKVQRDRKRGRHRRKEGTLSSLSLLSSVRDSFAHFLAADIYVE